VEPGCRDRGRPGRSPAARRSWSSPPARTPAKASTARPSTPCSRRPSRP
jgi:hypothetical protein